jgi:hypothetical protein
MECVHNFGGQPLPKRLTSYKSNFKMDPRAMDCEDRR